MGEGLLGNGMFTIFSLFAFFSLLLLFDLESWDLSLEGVELTLGLSSARAGEAEADVVDLGVVGVPMTRVLVTKGDATVVVTTAVAMVKPPLLPWNVLVVGAMELVAMENGGLAMVKLLLGITVDVIGMPGMDGVICGMYPGTVGG